MRSAAFAVSQYIEILVLDNCHDYRTLFAQSGCTTNLRGNNVPVMTRIVYVPCVSYDRIDDESGTVRAASFNRVTYGSPGKGEL